jgi:hypothetical protein
MKKVTRSVNFFGEGVPFGDPAWYQVRAKTGNTQQESIILEL